jgi:hypothetical protein
MHYHHAARKLQRKLKKQLQYVLLILILLAIAVAAFFSLKEEAAIKTQTTISIPVRSGTLR